MLIANRFEVAAWVLTALALLYVLQLHLLPALLAGLLVYELVAMLAPRFVSGKLSHSRAKIVVVALITTAVLGLAIAAVSGVVLFMRGEYGNLSALLNKMAEAVENSRNALPPALAQWLPQGDEAQIREIIVQWLRGHAEQIRQFGGTAGRVLVHIIIGLIIGAFVALKEGLPKHQLGPLAHALTERASHLGQAFRRVVFAQVRISLLNTALTAVYLGVLLPSFGTQLPFLKTMIIITFLVGLLPVLGNLVSNTMIVMISLTHSLGAAMASLGFLVAIHKLEYFVNAKIVGGQIKAAAWELLVAMLAMEAAFGVPGVIAAPIFYAYVKRELKERKLI